MTSALVQPGVLGFDAANFAKFTAFDRVKGAPGEKDSPNENLRGEFVSFYIGGDFGIGKAQLEAAWRNGLPVMPNFERNESAALGGYRAGMDHATTAVRQLHELGFLGECPVIFSGVDFGPVPSQFPQLDMYHRALVEHLEPINWVGGAYGPKSYLQHLVQLEWWPSHWPIWHWGGDGSTVYPWAWVKQGPGPSYFNPTIGFGVDDNVVHRAIPMWTGYGPDKELPPPPPIPPAYEEQSMSYFRYTPEGYVAEIHMGYKKWISGDYFYGVIQGQLQGSGVTSPVGIYATPAPLDKIQAIPDEPTTGSGTTIRGIRITSVPGDAAAF